VGLLISGALSDERSGLSFTMYNVQYNCILHAILSDSFTNLVSPNLTYHTNTHTRTHTNTHARQKGCIMVTFELKLAPTQSHVTTDDQSASLSWNKAPLWGLRLDFHYCQTIAGLLIWGALGSNWTTLTVISSRHRSDTENTALLLLRVCCGSHVIAIQPVHWRADWWLATVSGRTT
jgi:hypothetical protein